MRILNDIPVEIDPEDVFKRLHLDGNGQYASEVTALIDSARRVARPRALYKVARVEDKQGDTVVVVEAGPGRCDGRRLPESDLRGAAGKRARFESRVLRKNLDRVERVFPYVATCGPELDSVPIPAGDVFAQYCRDTIKEIALWTAIARLYEHLQETYDLEGLASVSPGTDGNNVWPIEQQRELFSFVGNVGEAIGVVLTESCLMVPNKSVSGVFYPSEDGFENCQLCRQERCPDRHAPFDPHLWERMLADA